MSSKQELLLDLLKIKVKYTEKDISEIFSLLENEGYDQTVLDIIKLVNMIDVKQRRDSIEKTPKKTTNLEKIKNNDYDQYLNLINFRDKLLNRSIDVETKDLHRFTGELGIPSSKGRKREQTIKIIIEHLAGLKTAEANRLIEQELWSSQESVNKFEMLADAILQRPSLENPDNK
ncbi:hypothetical protein [Paenibacillus odorifer]|uniref:hypothetical protein n=1 Tax=Paenibacillus TaxID=44249 RepID=UPI003F876BB2